ncbi:MAG: cytochrome c, partial [Flavobacteriaceae bacterium]|nr:cytochrome c [Flavobacteriaceae bacterium]
ETCVLCHGNNGKGDGPGGKTLKPKPADLTSKSVQAQTDGEIFWKITKGRGAMAQWEHIIDEKDRWNLVNYIRTLK